MGRADAHSGGPSKLRAWREAQGLMAREVADLTGLSESMVSRIERGERRLSPVDRVAFARRLGARVGDLFEVEPLDISREVAAS